MCMMMNVVFEKSNSKLTISLIVFIITIVILTYFWYSWSIVKDALYGGFTHDTVEHTRYSFTYSNQRLFKTVIDARRRNCINDTRNGTLRICDIRDRCNNYMNQSALSVSFNGSKEMNNFNTEDDRQLNGCTKRFPGAVIIGVFKSGTRAIIDFLDMNPVVVIKRDLIDSYEVSYFDKWADKGDEWYREQMPFSLQDQITVEKSPSYFYSLQTPRRLHDFNRNIKLILIARDPTDRVISHLTFEKVLIERKYENNVYNCLFKYDPLRNRTVLNKHCFAVKYSIYDEPMERYLKYFPLKQILVIDGSEFMMSPCRVLRQVETFLGVNSYINCEDFIYNEDKRIFCIRNGEMNNSAACYSRTRGRANELSVKFESVRNKLQQYFKPHNERFFSLIGRTFNWN